MARLAGRGGRDVGRRFAHDSGISAAMTGRTTGRDPRVIHRSARPEGRRRFVARLAPERGWEVGRRFAHNPRSSAAMTGRATRRDPRVTKRGPRKRGGGLMARLTGRRGRDVGRRFGHDSGISAAMTGRTTGRDPRVIHRGARPEGRRRFVARLAPERGWEVGRRFAHNPRSSAAMTGRATRRDPRVTKRGPRKRGGGLMARLAGLRGRYVRRRFAQRRPAVMARGAAGRDPRVVIACGHKDPIRRAHSVAGIARSSCRHVPSRLPAGLDSVMAGRAGTGGHPHVFERCARPGHSSMATIAGHRGREMRRGLSLCGTVVMAPCATSRSDAVMGKECGFPTCGPMATVTVHRGGQMVRRLKG